MAHMGLNQDDPEHIDLYDSIAGYWVQKRLIQPWASGSSMIQITARGIDHVEGNRPQDSVRHPDHLQVHLKTIDGGEITIGTQTLSVSNRHIS